MNILTDMSKRAARIRLTIVATAAVISLLSLVLVLTSAFNLRQATPNVVVTLPPCAEEDGSGPRTPCVWVDPDGTGVAVYGVELNDRGDPLSVWVTAR